MKMKMKSKLRKRTVMWGRGKEMLAFLFFPTKSTIYLAILMVVIVVLLNVL